MSSRSSKYGTPVIVYDEKRSSSYGSASSCSRSSSSTYTSSSGSSSARTSLDQLRDSKINTDTLRMTQRESRSGNPVLVLNWRT